MTAPKCERERPADEYVEAAPIGHLVTTRSTRIVSADVAAATLLARSVPALEREVLEGLVEADARVAFRDRVMALADDDAIDGWRLSFRGPDEVPIALVAAVRTVVGDEGGRVLRWHLAADPCATLAVRDVGSRPDMACVLRQLAHELNQPLAAIVTYARGSQMRLDGNTLSDADLRAALEVIVKEAMRATEIVRACDRRWGKT